MGCIYWFFLEAGKRTQDETAPMIAGLRVVEAVVMAPGYVRDAVV